MACPSLISKNACFFSETDGETDWDANQHFDAEHDDTEYEAKITKLLHRSYTHAKGSVDEVAQWQVALETLRDVDFYGLVMVDQARIPHPKPHISVIGEQIAQGFWSLENPLFLAAKVTIVILAIVLLLDPFHWGLVRADYAKLCCIAIATVAFWLVGRIEKRTLLRKIEAMADPTLR
jgi:hypothetical protein